MKIIKNSSEDEMILEFLAMEIKSERYFDKIKKILQEMRADINIIYHGSLLNETENRIRREILGHFRGYGKNESLFEHFPLNARWIWAILDNFDFPKVKYINYSYWNELSNFSGSPLEAAKTISKGKTIFDVPNDGFWEALNSLKKGITFPPLIVITDNNEDVFYLVEGHKRITAYALEPDLFKNVTVILGYCESTDIKKWYGEINNLAY